MAIMTMITETVNHQQLLLNDYILMTNKMSGMKQNHVKLEVFILNKIL